MKTYNKPATSKLLVRFDNELKQLLMEDLKAFRAKNNQRNNQPVLHQQAAWSTYTSTYKNLFYLPYEKRQSSPVSEGFVFYTISLCF